MAWLMKMRKAHLMKKLVRKEAQKMFYWSHLGSEGWFELRSEDVVGSEAGPKTQASPAPGGGTSRRGNISLPSPRRWNLPAGGTWNLKPET